MDMSGRMLTVSAVEVALRAMDFDLLAALVRRPGAVRTHDQLGAVLRETEHDPVEALRQHVLVLRHALRAAEPGTERYLEVVRGEGYRFREQPVAPDAPATLSAPPVQLDRRHRSVTLRGAAVPLRPKVFDLLVELVSRPGQVLTHQQLATSLLRPGRGGPGDHGEIARRVWLLRAAIELNPAQPRLVVTVAGVGYRFDPEQPVPTGVRAVRTAEADPGGRHAPCGDRRRDRRRPPATGHVRAPHQRTARPPADLSLPIAGAATAR